MDEPRPHCNLCDGTGRRPLTNTERSTYALVTDEWETTHVLLEKAPRGVYRTMLLTRLAVLVTHGIVEAKRDPAVPRVKLWRRVGEEASRD